MNPLQMACDIFQDCRSNVFWNYFNKRRVDKALIDLFQLGYVPSYPVLTHQSSLRSAFRHVGLLNRIRHGRDVDEQSYLNHYSFPYLTSKGITSIMFRLVDDTEDDAKYKNLGNKVGLACAPGAIEKPIYYGLPEALLVNEIVIVEGPFDLYRCFQAGLPHTVALAGNTPNFKAFLDLIKGKKAYLMLDWDESGRRRTFEMCLEYLSATRTGELIVIEAPMNDGKDPGDLAEAKLKSIFDSYQVTPEQFVKSFSNRSIDTRDLNQVRLLNQLVLRGRV